MKKKIVLAALSLIALSPKNNLSAQSSSPFYDVKGMNLVNAGIGVGTYGLNGTGGVPLTASFEHGFSKNISGGLEAGFIQRRFAFNWKYTYLIIGPRASYHFNEILKVNKTKLDIYGGAGLLYRHFSVKYNDSEFDEFDGKSSAGDMIIGLHAGGRYFFNDKLGAFAEVGYGVSALKLGVSVKL